MGFSVGDLFMNLGIKGSEKTLATLGNVKTGLKDTASLSLEAKAGIIAAMYALEKLFAASGAAGTGLTNFNSLVGVSAQTLQKYQYAARQMGVANEDVAGSFKSLQGAMTKTLMGEGAPKGLAMVARMTGGIKKGDLLDFQKHPELLIQKLQEYAQKEKNVGLRNETLKSFGLGDPMIAALSRQAFNPGALAKAPTYGDKEIGALDRANIAWSNLGTKIEMAVGHFNARHGGQLVTDISKIVDGVVKLSEALVRLGETLKVFEIFSKILQGSASVVGSIATDVGLLNSGDSKKKKEVGKDILGNTRKTPGVLGAISGIFHSLMDDKPKSSSRAYASASGAAPTMSPQLGAGSTQNVNVQQNLHFSHEGKDHKKTGDSVRKANQEAFRQIPQGQAN